MAQTAGKGLGLSSLFYLMVFEFAFLKNPNYQANHKFPRALAHHMWYLGCSEYAGLPYTG